MTKKHSVHLYLDEAVHDYLLAKLDGTQSISSYFLQRSGIIPEYRQFLKQGTPNHPAVTPTPQLVEAKSCDTCNLVQCDPSCPLLDKPAY